MVHPGRLLGRAEVLIPMKDLSYDQRINIARKCWRIVTEKPGGVVEKEVGRVENGLMGVSIDVTQAGITVVFAGVVIHSIGLTRVSAMATMAKRSGQLVVIGKCNVRDKRMAMMFQLEAATDADQLIDQYQQQMTKKKDNKATPGQAPHLSCQMMSPTIAFQPNPDVRGSTPQIQGNIYDNPDLANPPPKSPLLGLHAELNKVLTTTGNRSIPQRIIKQSSIGSTPPPLPPRKNDDSNENYDNPDEINTSSLPLSSASYSHQDVLYGNNTPKDRTIRAQAKGFLEKHMPKPITEIKKNTKNKPSTQENLYGTTPSQTTSNPCQVVHGSVNPGHSKEPSGDYEEWDDEFDEDETYDYVNNDQYYVTLGFNVMDSERVYMDLPPRPSDTNDPLEKVILGFLTEEHKYLTIIENLDWERRSMKPILQSHLNCIAELPTFHQNMYTELFNTWESPSGIANVFLSHQKDLKIYEYYLMNAPKINELMTEVGATLAQNVKEDIRTSWKRPHFYIMGLEQILAKAPASECDSLKKAIAMLKELQRNADMGILLDAVHCAPFDLHLRAPLILHSAFKAMGPGVPREEYRVLLFSELLVITKPLRDAYKFQVDLRLEQVAILQAKGPRILMLEENLGGNRGKKKYMLQAPMEEIALVWRNKLLELMNIIANKVKQQQIGRFGHSSILTNNAIKQSLIH